MFTKQSNQGYQTPLAGVDQKTLVYGEKTLMTEFRLQKGCAIPLHAHPHEQTGYLVEGRLQLTVGEVKYEVQSGDSWCIPGGVEHGADVIENAVAIEVFAPVREDYLPE
jgi:quercetin dioxygenase-like cupin family protein